MYYKGTLKQSDTKKNLDRSFRHIETASKQINGDSYSQIKTDCDEKPDKPFSNSFYWDRFF